MARFSSCPLEPHGSADMRITQESQGQRVATCSRSSGSMPARACTRMAQRPRVIWLLLSPCNTTLPWLSRLALTHTCHTQHQALRFSLAENRTNRARVLSCRFSTALCIAPPIHISCCSASTAAALYICTLDHLRSCSYEVAGPLAHLRCAAHHAVLIGAQLSWELRHLLCILL